MTALTPGSAEAVALLAWYREVGVDAALSDEPVDWFARGAARPGADFVWPESEARVPQRAGATTISAEVRQPSRPQVAPVMQPRIAPVHAPPALGIVAPQRQFPSATPDEATMAARVAARSAKDLDQLRVTLAGFNGCALKATAKSLCFYRGAAQSRIMLIGEAPGRDEDLAGKPFVGRAGQLLDKMLAAIGLSEADSHITNIVYWRPPGNRPPTPQEAEVCRPFVERQIELVAPDIVLLLGGAAAKHILGVPEGIMRLRGKWHDITIGGRSMRAMATLHPEYLLRTPAAKRQAWRDLLAVKSALGG